MRKNGGFEKVSVVLVEDHAVYRESIAQAIGELDFYQMEGMYSNLEDALDAVDSGLRADIVLLDLGLPGMSGLDGIGPLREKLPAARIIVLTAFTDREKVFAALENGAHGYIIKAATINRLLRALDEVAGGGTPIDPQIADMVLNRFKQLNPQDSEERLSDRERDIMMLVADGLTKKEIADRLNISTPTVATYIRRIFDKLHVRNLPEAVSVSIRRGLLDFSS